MGRARYATKLELSEMCELDFFFADKIFGGPQWTYTSPEFAMLQVSCTINMLVILHFLFSIHKHSQQRGGLGFSYIYLLSINGSLFPSRYFCGLDLFKIAIFL